MEFSPHIKPVSRPWLVRSLLQLSLCLCVASVSAVTSRWKDKDGNTPYSTAIPTQYSAHPSDVLNAAGMVIERVEDTSVPQEVRTERKSSERAPLISAEERQRQSDHLLVIQYRSEEDIQHALVLEIAQLGYDSKIFHQSFDSAVTAIRAQVRLAAEKQRAGMQINAKQQKQIDRLYRRIARDEQRISALDRREAKIRARFKSDLDRYRQLTTGAHTGDQENAEESLDQG